MGVFRQTVKDFSGQVPSSGAGWNIEWYIKDSFVALQYSESSLGVGPMP